MGASAAGASALGASAAGASALGASAAGASTLGASAAGASTLGASAAGASALGASAAGASTLGFSAAGASTLGFSAAALALPGLQRPSSRRVRGLRPGDPSRPPLPWRRPRRPASCRPWARRPAGSPGAGQSLELLPVAGDLQDRGDGVGGLCAYGQPVLHPVGIHADHARVLLGVVHADSSMARPPRAVRASATTMRYCGTADLSDSLQLDLDGHSCGFSCHRVRGVKPCDVGGGPLLSGADPRPIGLRGSDQSTASVCQMGAGLPNRAHPLKSHQPRIGHCISCPRRADP